jgi:hypothetical protein
MAVAPYTWPELHSSALITIDTQRDVLDGRPLAVRDAISGLYEWGEQELQAAVRLDRPSAAQRPRPAESTASKGRPRP